MSYDKKEEEKEKNANIQINDILSSIHLKKQNEHLVLMPHFHQPGDTHIELNKLGNGYI